MKRILPIVCSLFYLNLLFAHTIDSEKVLKRELGDSLEFVSNTEVRFCPVHKCDVYKISSPNSDFIHYIFLRLFNQKGYLTISESIHNRRKFNENTQKEASILRNQLAHYCLNDPINDNCILRQMEKSLGIKICYGIYDEGQYCETCEKNTNCKNL